MSALRKKSKARNRDELAFQLASGFPVAVAAARAGYSAKQAGRIAVETEFAARVRVIKGAIWQEAAARLAALNIKAAARLERLIASRDDATALRAARIVLTSAPVIAQAAELDSRLAAIEARLDALAPGHKPERLTVA